LIRWVYTNNPFYAISAALVFVGLRASFDTHGKAFESWALMSGLAGYTLLLAATACVLVRLGEVWDDVRTVLLLVVLMFLATSVTFDYTLASNPALGRALFVGGLVFATAVSEGVLRSLRLALPAGYRVPYYLCLALFFLYPVALAPLLTRPNSPVLHWALFGFSPAAGLVSLTLIPAVRRGAGYVSKNGSPWPWPLYPWALFAFLAAGVAARSYSLCVSFHFVLGSRNIFGAYFLVPFLFALVVLLLEAGIASRRRGVQLAALVAPLGLLALATAGSHRDPLYWQFLATFRHALGGSPLFLTLLATAAFHAYAISRRVRTAPEALTASLLALAVVGPDTYAPDALLAPRPLPILAAGVLHLALAVRGREAWRGLVGSGLLVTAATLGLGDAWTPSVQVAFAFHLATAAVLVLGVVVDDPLGRLLRRTGAVLLMAAGVAGVCANPGWITDAPREALQAYPLVVALLALGYGLLVRDRLFYAAAAAGSAAWLAVAGARGYATLRRLVVGLDQIALGLLFFLLAATISLIKTGAVARWLGRRDGGEPMAGAGCAIPSSPDQ
jgi:hypothetical protein